MSVVVVVGTRKGAAVYRSDDRLDWEMDGLLFKGWKVTAVTRDETGRWYLGLASENYATVIATSDDLVDWEQVESGPNYDGSLPGNPMHNQLVGLPGETRHLDQIWKLHAAHGAVYAGVSEAGLFRSTDRGQSWEPIARLNDHADRASWTPGFGGLCAHTILTDPGDADRIWCGISAVGAFRSDDGGGSWRPCNDGVLSGEGFCVHSMVQSPDDPDTIFRQDHLGVYRSRDAGDSWERIEDGLPEGHAQQGHVVSFGFPIVADPHTGAVYVVPMEGDDYRVPHGGALRVYRTTDGGDSWHALYDGLPQQGAFTNVLRGAIAVDGMDPGGIYFGTTSGEVYASADRGESWQRLPGSLPRVLCVGAFA